MSICTKNLIFEEIFNLSSIKPTIDKGIQIKVTKSPDITETKILCNGNTMPPPVGVGRLWELLLSGISIIFFLKKKGRDNFIKK